MESLLILFSTPQFAQRKPPLLSSRFLELRGLIMSTGFFQWEWDECGETEMEATDEGGS